MSEQPTMCGLTMHDPNTGRPMMTFNGTDPGLVVDLYAAWARHTAMIADLEALLTEPEPTGTDVQR